MWAKQLVHRNNGEGCGCAVGMRVLRVYHIVQDPDGVAQGGTNRREKQAFGNVVPLLHLEKARAHVCMYVCMYVRVLVEMTWLRPSEHLRAWLPRTL